MRYALVRTADNTIDRWASNVDPTVQTKAGFKWLPGAPVAPPAFDPVLETVDGPTYTIGASAVTEIWTKRSLTGQEISDRKDSAISMLNGGLYAPLLAILLTVVNDARDTRAKMNAMIDATGQAATVAKYPPNQTTQINKSQLVTAIKALI